MITQVFDDKGELLHDCAVVGCAVSWDGYLIADGSPVQGRQDPSPALWAVQGKVARLKPGPPAR